MLLNCGVGDDSWESLGQQGDQAVHPTGNQSWIFIGRTDDEAETPILWPFDAKDWLIRKDPDAGKDWRQEEKGMTEDEMVGWHRWLNGHEFLVSSESWWWTGRPGTLQSMGSQRVGHDWATELNWTTYPTCVYSSLQFRALLWVRILFCIASPLLSSRIYSVIFKDY